MLIKKAFVFVLLVVCNMPTASLSTTLHGRPKLQTPTVLHSNRGLAKATSLAAAGNALHAEPPSAKIHDGGEASMSVSTFNLAKSIIGAGVLSLPSGVAFFADEPSALVPSVAICAVFGLMAAYTFSSIGNICREYDADNFKDAWAKSVGAKSAWIIPSSITALCFMASLAYSIIIGDSFTALARTFQLPPVLCDRTNVILLLSSVVLLPLCSLQNLSSLAPFSLLGLGGTLYTAAFMLFRFLEGSYGANGRFIGEIALAPTFGMRGGYQFNHRLLVLLSMLSTSYIAHYNAPKFFTELKNNTMARFNTVVGSAFGTAVAFFSLIMCVGFLTFGGATQGLVLNNYASKDTLATMARLAIGIALVTGYPFTFSALKEGVLDMLHLKGDSRQRAIPKLAPILLAVVTGLALALKDVGFVVSISGAMFGCALMFMVPAIMNINNFQRLMDLGRPAKSHNLKVTANYFLIITGALMSVLGVGVSVLNQMGKL